MIDVSFATYVDRLRQRLAGPLPGPPAQLSMAPDYRTDPSIASIDGKNCREAGVLALFFPLDGAPALVLTVRRDHLPDHAGQVAFPGGQREPDETLQETALREAHEEIHLLPDLVDMLGPLTPLYIPPSNFCVHPFVGAAFQPPELHPTDAEVGTILRVPLPHLLDPATLTRETWTLHGERVEVPFFDIDGYKVWGATAMMLAELLQLCTDALEASQ